MEQSHFIPSELHFMRSLEKAIIKQSIILFYST